MNITRIQLAIFTILSFFILSETSAQEVISIELKRTRTLAQLNDDYAEYGSIAQNGVELYAITYSTDDVFGERDTASGLLIIPIREGDFAYPMLCYQHGTVASRNDVPSNLQGGFQLGEVFSSIGYVVVAPDFLGLGTSRGFHPYVHADSEASAGIDMILAVKKYAEENEIFINDQLFISGYSQGGHAAMALQRAIEANPGLGLDVTASAPLSGPYSISEVMKDQILSDSPYFYPAYVPNTLLSYNYVYGIFDDPISATFKEPYATDIERFYNEEINLTQLNSLLIQKLQSQTGGVIAKRILHDSIITILLEEPEHPLNVALRDNDLLDWTPQAPTRLVYCMADDQVPFRNSTLADSLLNANGALDLESVDVNSNFNHGQCATPANVYAAIFFDQYKEITTSSVPQDIQPLNIHVFPNPTSSEIFFSKTETGMKATLISMTGNKILEQDLIGNNMDLKGISSGLYVLRIESSKGASQLVKLVVR